MWAEVFLTQARSDWEIYEHFKKTRFPECHSLHYLQMTTEKLAKAYLLVRPDEAQTVLSTHRALVRFLRDVSRNPRLQKEMRMSGKQLRVHIHELLHLAYEIENLAPALSNDGPNPEYPWIDPAGDFHTPATHEFALNRTLNEPRGYSLLKLIRIALITFETLH